MTESDHPHFDHFGAGQSVLQCAFAVAFMILASGCSAATVKKPEASLYTSASGLLVRAEQIGKVVDIGLHDATPERHELCSEPRTSVCISGPWVNFEFPTGSPGLLPTLAGQVSDHWVRGAFRYRVRYLGVFGEGGRERYFVIESTRIDRPGCEESYLVSSILGLVAFELCSPASIETSSSVGEREAPTRWEKESYFLISGRGLGADSLGTSN